MREWVVVSCALAGCYTPAPCEITCTTECPGDLQCVAGFCTNGETCPVHEDYVAIGVGARHVCALTEHDELFCWGDNAQGQLGIAADNTGDSAMSAIPTRVRDPASWSALAVGAEHTCGVHDGAVYCWGLDDQGQVSGAPGGVVTTPMPVPFATTPPVMEQVAAGIAHSCAIGQHTLWCWGVADQIGLNNAAPSVATQLPGDDWVAIAAAGTHSCGVAMDGSVRCFGSPGYGQLGSSATGTTPAPVVGLPSGQVAIRIAVGDDVSCAIMADPGAPEGELWCWGRNDVGQLADVGGDKAAFSVFGNDATWTAIAISGFHANNHQRLCGVHAAGTAVCWGNGDIGTSGDGTWNAEYGVPPSKATSIGAADQVALYADSGDDPVPPDEVGCVLRGKQVACWGENTRGELGLGLPSLRTTPIEVAPPSGLTWTHVRSGHNHACAQASDQTLWCWGADGNGQVSAGAARGIDAPCVADLPCDRPTPIAAPVPVGHPDDIVLGDEFSCEREGATIHCWGNHGSGQLGVANPMGDAVTTVMSPSGPWTKLMGGDKIVCGACGTGCLACWGIVTTTQYSTPQPVPAGAENLDEIHSGLNFICGAQYSAMARVCWGDNGDYQLGDGTTTARPTNPETLDVGQILSVGAGGLHACAIGSGPRAGQIACWGANDFNEGGVANPPSRLMTTTWLPTSNCSAISLAESYTCAICDGSAACWGDNSDGQLGRGSVSSGELPGAVALPNDHAFAEIATGSSRACALDNAGRLYCWGYGPFGELGDGSHDTNLPTPIGPRR